MAKAKFYVQDAHAPRPNRPNHVGMAIFLHKDRKVLLEYRADSDFWCLIGGALEIDESLTDGILREVREETGLLLEKEALRFLRIYDDPSRIIAYPDGAIVRSITVCYEYALEQFPPLTCSEESRMLRFFAKEELQGLPIAKTHVQLLEDFYGESCHAKC